MFKKQIAKVLLVLFMITLAVPVYDTRAFAAAPSSDLLLSYVTQSVYSSPEAVALGDVNNDGRNDVVITTSHSWDPDNDFKMFVFLQNSSGGLEPPVKYNTGGTYTNRPESVDIGDLNKDGKNDIVIGNLRKNIEVFLQNESGGLDPGVAYPTNNSHSVKIGDVNNDNRIDVIALSWGSDNDSVDVFLQNQVGTLNSPVTYTVKHGGYDELEVEDVNNDGLTDIIVMSGQGFEDNIGVLLQQPNNTFDQPAVYYDLGGNELTTGVGVGDIDSDDLNDIVVCYGWNRPSSNIAVFNQNELGALNPAVNYGSYDAPQAVEIGDLNLDGKNDIVVLSGEGNKVGVYLQNDDRTLREYELYSMPPHTTFYSPKGLAVGDINTDGHADVVIADPNNDLVILYGAPLKIRYKSPSGFSDAWPDETIDIYFNKYIHEGENFSGINISTNETVVNFTYSVNGNKLTLDPDSNLEYSTTYNVSIPAGAVKDFAGNGLKEEYNYAFKTISPTVIVASTDPVGNAENVPVNKTITVNFNTSVQTGANFANISLMAGTTVTSYTYSLDGNRLIITPSTNLAYSTNYVLRIPAGAVVDNGYSLDSNYSLYFTTVAESAPGVESGNDNPSGPTGTGGTSNSTGTVTGTDISNTTTSSVSQVDGQSVATLTLNEAAALNALNGTSNGGTVIIRVGTTSDVVNTKIPTGLLTALVKKSSSIEIQTGTGAYVLPVSEIKMPELVKQLGAAGDSDIIINISIAKVKPEQIASVQKFVEQHNLTQLVTPVEFKVEALSGDKKVEIDKFTSYVSRNINLPGAVNPNTSVGVVQNADGTLTPVPTQFKQENGKTIAVLKRKTNSTYTVVQSQKTFRDTELHWAKEDVNTLASKLIITGINQNVFGSENKITRAEFAMIIARALGLEQQAGSVKFSDIKTGDWYAGAVGAVVDAGIFNGYGDGTFRPNAFMTREEVAASAVQALKAAGIDTSISELEVNQYIKHFKDSAELSSWARSNVALAAKLGIINGNNNKSFKPDDNCTRAEAAVIIKKLLVNADFI